jgi:addiction module HigA family antidote
MHNPPHPGEILKELYLIPLGLTVGTLALHLGVTRNTVSQLLNGHRGISPEMALRLAKLFDTTPEYWLNLNQKRELYEARQKINVDHIQPLSSGLSA